MHLLPLYTGIKAHSSCFFYSLSHVRSLLQFLSSKPRKTPHDSLSLSIRTILISSPLMHLHQAVFLLTLFKSTLLAKWPRLFSGDEFVLSIYCFITHCATGSISPQEPSDLFYLKKWPIDPVLIPEKWHQEKPHSKVNLSEVYQILIHLPCMQAVQAVLIIL